MEELVEEPTSSSPILTNSAYDAYYAIPPSNATPQARTGALTPDGPRGGGDKRESGRWVRSPVGAQEFPQEALSRNERFLPPPDPEQHRRSLSPVGRGSIPLRRRDRSPSPPPPLARSAFLDTLQRQHQARVSESMEAASRIIASKETEINRLTDKLRAAQGRFMTKERELRSYIAELEEEKDQLMVDSDGLLQQQKELHTAEVEHLRLEHQEEVNRIRQEAEERAAQTKEWCQQQIGSVESSREVMLENLRGQHKEQDAANAQKLKELNENYFQQISELHRMLNSESERLAQAREEICSVTVAKNHELSSLRSKLDVMGSSIDQTERAHAKDMRRLREEFDAKEREYQALVQSIRRENSVEKGQMEKYLKESEAHTRKLEALVEETQNRCEEKLQAAFTEIDYLNRSLDGTQQLSQKEIRENKELLELVRQLQRENGILKNEITLLEEEETRLREENTELKFDVGKLKKIVYGRTHATNVRYPTK